jgi:Tfp pilus assembly protein PilX
MQLRIKRFRHHSRYQRQVGFVLLGALLLLLLVSAVAVTVAYTVNSERNISSSDEEGNLAYYGAEAGMEKMTGDLGALYATTLAPSQSQISNLGSAAFLPSMPGIDYNAGYSVQCTPAPPPAPASNCLTQPDSIKNGPYAGLNAEIIPINLQVTATRDSIAHAQARMTRIVQVGLIPVFQFGVFSDHDLSFFPGPPMEFNGRVHTNSNLFVTADSSNTNPGITFHAKVTARLDIIITQLANTLLSGKVNGTCYGPAGGCSATTTGPYEGPVFVPTAANNGCYDAAGALSITTSCTQLIYGSVTGGPGSAPEGLPWTAFSTGTTNKMVLSGAPQLTLPFVQAGVGPIEIIRQPIPGEDSSTAVGQSRLYNEAQIRVLLADTPADLPGGIQGGDVWLDNYAPNGAANGAGTIYTKGVVVLHPALGGASPAYFANGKNGSDPNWTFNPGNQHTGANSVSAPAQTWPGVGGWLRVEVRIPNSTLFRNVTQEWLTLGFARGTAEPTHAAPNSIHPDAILILQRLTTTAANIHNPLNANDISGATAAPSEYNWYPINLYDAREGLYNDSAATSGNPTASNCPVAGVMNLVELDVRNLQKWLQGKLPVNQAGAVVLTVTDSNLKTFPTATGPLVENTSQNGYILYFSDRRGMLPNPDNTPPGTETGKRGSFGYPQQGLDIAEDHVIETYGGANIGNNFNLPPPSNTNPSSLINCSTVGRTYPVSGARHALRVLDGGSGDLPAIFDGPAPFSKAASRSPVSSPCTCWAITTPTPAIS